MTKGSSTVWGLLLHPERTVRQQRLAIHQKRAHVWEAGPQAIQDGEAVRIDVAPIVDVPLRHPRSRVQEAGSIPHSEYDDGLLELGKRQAVHLVFGQENMACGDIEGRKIADRNCEI